MKKCTYTYKGITYSSRDNLYPTILAELEAKPSLLILENKRVTEVFEPSTKAEEIPSTTKQTFTVKKTVRVSVPTGTGLEKVSFIINSKENPNFVLFAVKTKSNRYDIYTSNNHLVTQGLEGRQGITDFVDEKLSDLLYSLDDNVKTQIGYHNTQKQLETIQAIEAKAKDVVLDEALNKYVNLETGKHYNRVSNVINGNKEINLNADGETAVMFGNRFDNLLRDIMNGTLQPLSAYNTIKDSPLFKNEAAYEAFVQQAINFKQTLLRRGEVVVNNNGKEIVLYNNIAEVAGAVDLMTVDTYGNVRIYDYKTMKGNRFIESYYGESVPMMESTQFGEMSTIVKYTKQQSYYKELFEKMFNVPVKNISLIPIELNKYDVTDTSVNYAEIKDVVPLNPMEVSLSKARPEVTLPSIKDFFANHEVTENDRQRARDYLNQPDLRTFKLLTEEGEGTVTVLQEDGDDSFYTIKSKDFGNSGVFRTELLETLAKSLAYDNLKENAIDEIENNTVNSTSSVTVSIPATQEEIDTLFEKPIEVRPLSESVVKENKDFILKHAKGDRITADALPAILDSFTTSTKNVAQKELLKLVIDNIGAFEKLPIILDTTLTGRGILVINNTTKEISGIRINPNLIKDQDAFRTVLLEELAHTISYERLRDKNSVHTKRLNNLRQTAIEFFGQDKMAYYAKATVEMSNLGIKKAADALTEEETVRYNELVDDKNMAIYYRLSSLDEFTVGLFLSANLQTFLNSLDIEQSNNEKVKTLWDKIIDLINDLFGIYNPMLKYGLYDAITLFEKTAKEYKNNPELLDVVGSHRKTVNEINTLFNLRDSNNNLNKITNGEEVANLINTNVFNVIAEYDAQSETINVLYKDVVGLRAGEAADDIAEDTTKSRLDREDDFKSKIKSYFINLTQRQNTLKKELNREVDTSSMSPEEFREFAVKRNKLKEELQTLTGLKKNLTGKGDINVNNLYRLSEQAFGELDNIEKFINNNMNEADLLYSFQTLKFWLNARHLMFDAVDITDEGAISRFTDVEKRAKLIEVDLIKALNKWTMTEVVGKNTTYTGSLDAMLKSSKDLGNFSAEVSDLSKINSPLMQGIGTLIKRTDVDLSKERADRLRRFEEVVKKAKASLKHYANGIDGFEVFRQLDEFGRPTLNMVSRFSNKYAQDRKVLNFVYTSQDKNKDEAYEAFKFVKNNTEIVNLRTAFPEDGVPTDESKSELDRVNVLLGDAHFAEWLNKQNKFIKSYKEEREGYIIYLEGRFGITEGEIASNESASNMLGIWENRNSPYRLSDRLNNDAIKGNPFTVEKGNESFKYYVDIPKKEIVNKAGVKQAFNYYDSKFQTIEKDESLNALYEEMQDILKYVGSLIPYDSAEHLANGQLPEFQKEMYKVLLGNMKKGLRGVTDALVDMIGTEKHDSTPELDIVTGKDKKSIRLGIKKSNQLITRDLMSARIQHYSETSKNFTAEEEADAKSKITAKYAGEMDFDLGTVFSRYLQLGLAYEYKGKIENTLVLSQMMVNEQREFKRDNKGNLVKDPSFNAYVKYDEKEAADSFINHKRVLGHTIDSIMYGIKRDINSSTKKTYNKSEKELKSRYENQIKELDKLLKEGTIETEQHKVFTAKLEKYINDLGTYVDQERLIDLPIKAVQYLGMGWNIIGGISNMGFGTISNMVEGAGEELYTSSQLMDAYKTVIGHSARRNATFNAWGTDEALKIRALMDSYDIMAESNKEYIDLIGDDLTGNLKFAAAFNMNQRTEYINQAPLMLVMMRNTKFEHEGKQYSIYEGFNKDGSWNEDSFGEYPTEVVNKTVLKIKALIQRNHGNYNPLAPMLAKKSGVGRLLIQFRSWMIEGYRVRLGNRYGEMDEIFETEIRGRYHSLVDVVKDDWKGSSLSTIKQVLYNFIPFKSNLGIKSSPITSYFEGREGARTVDVANMKRVAMELNLLIGVWAAGMVLKLIASGLDDDDPEKLVVTLLLNQSVRLRTDILMYANPNEALKIVQDPVPALKLMGNAEQWFKAAEKTLEGSPSYESGNFQGHNRLLKETFEGLPFLSQPYKVATSMMNEYK